MNLILCSWLWIFKINIIYKLKYSIKIIYSFNIEKDEPFHEDNNKQHKLNE